MSFYSLRKENDKINYTLDEYKERLYQADERFIIVQAKIGKSVLSPPLLKHLN